MKNSSASAPAPFVHGHGSASALRSAARLTIAGLALVFAVGGMRAQIDVITPLPSTPTVPEVLRDPNASSDQSRIGPVGGSLLSYGPVSVHANLLYRYLYDEGLQVNGQSINSGSHTVAPGVNVDLGSHWSLSYNPSWTFYENRGLRNTVNQSISALGADTIADWGVQISQTYDKSTPLLIETGQQTDLRTWGTQLSASHDIGDQFQIQAVGGMTGRFGSTTPGVRDWSGQLWLTKSVNSALSVGVGPSYGYEDISAQPNMQYERYSARIDWRLTEKIKMHLQGGWEDRQILATARKTLRNPNVDGSIDYQPVETTTLSFSTSRDTEVSYLSNQITDASRWGVNLNQRLLEHFFLGAGYNHQRSSFTATSGNLTVDRVDKTDSYNLRLTTSILDHWTLSAVYTDSRNGSSAGVFGFNSRQYGVEVNCRY